MITEPDKAWLAQMESWLDDVSELLVLFTPAGCGGNGGYVFCKHRSELESHVARAKLATRITAFHFNRLSLRGQVDDDFICRAREMLRSLDGFLIVRLSERERSFGFASHVGDTAEDLEEYLEPCRGELVAFGPDPKQILGEHDISVAYKGGVKGAY